MADTLVAFTGWNNSTHGWGEGTWGLTVSPGLEATGSVGTVTIVEGVGVAIAETGLSATGTVNADIVTVIEGSGATVTPTGVSAITSVGDEFLWGEIVLPDAPTWTQVSLPSAPTWTQVST